MRGGFRRAISGGTPVSGVDIEGTRAAREVVREQVRLRVHVAELLSSAPVGGDGLRIVAVDSDEGDDAA